MQKREISRLKRHNRIKTRLASHSGRPRLVVRRSLKNFSACLIDDANHKVILTLSTCDKDIKSKLAYGGNVKASLALAVAFATRLKEKGISEVVFDRAGYLYHGRVRAFAEGLRKGGLKF